ncbi:MAG: hypothetical protein AAF950_14700 [Pseudomonadota bacterium]
MDTLTWLNGQLAEIERWRADAADAVSDGSLQFMDRLDAHRDWLVDSLQKLARQNNGSL